MDKTTSTAKVAGRKSSKTTWPGCVRGRARESGSAHQAKTHGIADQLFSSAGRGLPSANFMH
jgi:hypothetical protein